MMSESSFACQVGLLERTLDGRRIFQQFRRNFVVSL